MDIPDCMRAEEIRSVTIDDEHLGILPNNVLHSWPSMRAEVQKGSQLYWSFRDEIAIIYGITMKGKRIIIPASLQEKAPNQMHINHIGIEHIRLLACESIYWINMNTGKDETLKNYPTCLDFQAAQCRDKIISHEIQESI